MSNTNSVEVGFNAEVRQALADFVQAKADEKAAQARKASAEQVLRQALGESDTATIGGVVAFKKAHRSRTDIKRDDLRTNFPEVWAQVAYQNDYDFIDAVIRDN